MLVWCYVVVFCVSYVVCFWYIFVIGILFCCVYFWNMHNICGRYIFKRVFIYGTIVHDMQFFCMVNFLKSMFVFNIFFAWYFSCMVYGYMVLIWLGIFSDSIFHAWYILFYVTMRPSYIMHIYK